MQTTVSKEENMWGGHFYWEIFNVLTSMQTYYHYYYNLFLLLLLLLGNNVLTLMQTCRGLPTSAASASDLEMKLHDSYFIAI